MKKVIGFIGCVMLLCSCGIYKKYERPAVNTTNLYGKEAVLSDTVSIGQLHWSELFTDPQLRRLIEDGLKRNTDLRIAYLKVQEAQAARSLPDWLICRLSRLNHKVPPAVLTGRKRPKPTGLPLPQVGKSTCLEN